MKNALQYSHQLIKKRVQPGDLVVDATAGQGYDTLFLAQLVGAKGQVLSYDIQATAIAQTRKRLHDAKLIDQVQLIQRGHETLDQDLSRKRKIRAMMFNLGYLPGGDHAIITQPETTQQAIKKGLEFLLPRGIMTIVAYWGHSGGKDELVRLKEYLSQLDQKTFSVLAYQFINQQNQPPILFAIEKKRHP